MNFNRSRRWLLASPLAASAAAGTIPAKLQFPRDHGAHPETRTEWWYLTGLLGAGGQDPLYGFQLTFFRVKGPAAADHPSRFAARQLLLAHAAVSDLAERRLLHQQRIARIGFGLAEADSSDCSLLLRDWFLRRGAAGYSASMSSKEFSFELQLQTSQPLLLQGEQGLSRKGPQQTSFYTSEVQLQTQASLKIKGRQLSLQGLSWLDHEWSDSLLGSPGADQAAGWDWLGINLIDGGALTVFRLRRKDGSILWRGGSWRRADGSTLNFAPADVSMQPLRHWRSAEGAAYPVDWALQTPAGRMQLKALFDTQEIDARLSTGMRYWEGAAELLSPGGKRLGLGYLELTGYAGGMGLL